MQVHNPATGGAAVLGGGHRQVLRAGGRAVSLQASAELLIARTARDRNRPFLRSRHPG
ncbi:shikimate kinase [Pseudomonas aeruginosa]